MSLGEIWPGQIRTRGVACKLGPYVPLRLIGLPVGLAVPRRLQHLLGQQPVRRHRRLRPLPQRKPFRYTLVALAGRQPVRATAFRTETVRSAATGGSEALALARRRLQQVLVAGVTQRRAAGVLLTVLLRNRCSSATSRTLNGYRRRLRGVLLQRYLSSAIVLVRWHPGGPGPVVRTSAMEKITSLSNLYSSL